MWWLTLMINCIYSIWSLIVGLLDFSWLNDPTGISWGLYFIGRQPDTGVFSNISHLLTIMTTQSVHAFIASQASLDMLVHLLYKHQSCTFQLALLAQQYYMLSMFPALTTCHLLQIIFITKVHNKKLCMQSGGSKVGHYLSVYFICYIMNNNNSITFLIVGCHICLSRSKQ